MRRNTRGFLVVFALAFVGVLAFSLLFLAELLRERTAERRTSQSVSIPEVPMPEVVEPPALREAEPLPIVGRVVDGALHPMPDVTCVLRDGEAEERVTTEADGRFSFPPREESGEMELSLSRGEIELARWTVFAGSGGGARVRPEEFGSAREPVVPRPWRGLWSAVIFSNGDGEPLAAPAAGQSVGFQSVFELSALLVETAPPPTVPNQHIGSSGAVHYAGRTHLPDGAYVSASIYFVDAALGLADRLVAGIEPSEVRDGRFAGSFELPAEFIFYSAHYDFRLAHDAAYGEYEQTEAWKRELPWLPWERLENGEFVRQIYVGFPEEEVADNRRIGEHYASTLRAAVSLRMVHKKQVDELLKLAGGWDPALLARRQETRKSWIESGAVGADGNFREAAWRRFLDEDWRPRVAELLESLETRPEAKFGKAALDMKSLVGNTNAVSRMESTMVYGHFGLGAHPNDHYFDDYSPGADAAMLKNMMTHTVERLKRFTQIPLTEKREISD